MAQVGTDRIIEIQFSDGQYRLFLEFYAGGNILLTDKDLSIKALFRMVSEGNDQEQLRIGSIYLLENRQNYHGTPPMTEERVRAGLQKTLDEGFSSTLTDLKKIKKKPRDALRRAIATMFYEYPPILLDHALRVMHFDASLPIEDVIRSEDSIRRLYYTLKEAQRIDQSIKSSEVCKGYIIAKVQRGALSQPDNKQNEMNHAIGQQGLVYDDFQPFRPLQFEDDISFKILEFDGFNKTVDEFFSSIESQKLESRLTEKEEHAKKKLETARLDHEKRLGGLQQVQALNVRKANAIERNLQRVQEAINTVNSLVAQRIGWPEIARLIEMEQQRNNPIAEMVKLPLKLHENTVTLMLAEADFEDEADFEGNETGSDVSDSEDKDGKSTDGRHPYDYMDKRLVVDVGLDISPWSNARQYYDQRKTAAVKEQRTMQSAEKALKSTEQKINADLKKRLEKEKDTLRPQRRALWFEKFLYFVSSEGYLVLGAKDSQQCEIIYQNHLKRGDAYIHADLQGAVSTIVKNKPGKFDDPIPPSTLSQAGNLAVCTSSAWDSKAIMSAWWVNADQVSKTSHTGDYLQAGSFAIKGERNFLPPAQLLLGFSLMFKISEASKAQHLRHRIQADKETQSGSTTALEDTLNFEELTSPGECGQRRESPETNCGEEIQCPEYDLENMLTATPTGSDETPEDSQNRDVRYSEKSEPLQPRGAEYSASSQDTSQPMNATLSNSSSELEKEPIGKDALKESGIARAVSEAESSDSANRSSGKGTRHLSAKQRRLLRKGQPETVSAEISEESRPAITLQNPGTSSEASNKHASSTLQIRGKKGKRNKIRNKYANQDEEDRALAMRLLGSAAAQDKAREDIEAKLNKEEELLAAKERRRKQHMLAVEKGREAEERRRLLFEGVEELGEDEPETVEDIEGLVGAPLPGDEILDILVVCGPWNAIGSRCKWRAKLQPGTMKKGKAVKEILGAWNAAVIGQDKAKQTGHADGDESMAEEDKIRRREAELIRAIREPEVIGVVPVGKVRIMTGLNDGFSKTRGGGAKGKGKRGGRGSKRR